MFYYFLDWKNVFPPRRGEIICLRFSVTCVVGHVPVKIVKLSAMNCCFLSIEFLYIPMILEQATPYSRGF